MMRAPSRLWTMACIAGAAVVVGCAPAAPEPEILTPTRAGSVYLEAVCPVNDAWDTADVELDRLRLAAGRGQDDVEVTAFSEAMRAIAQADRRATAQLGDEQQSWPDGTGGAISEVRSTLESERKQALRVAELSASEAVAYEWQGAAESGDAAAAARAALGLPDDPVEACEQWRQSSESEVNEQPSEQGEPS